MSVGAIDEGDLHDQDAMIASLRPGKSGSERIRRDRRETAAIPTASACGWRPDEHRGGGSAHGSEERHEAH